MAQRGGIGFTAHQLSDGEQTALDTAVAGGYQAAGNYATVTSSHDVLAATAARLSTSAKHLAA